MTLLRRIRKARLVRVALVYLAAAWLVLEITELLQRSLDLPTWVVPVAIVLLLIGLVVIVSTAWVQSLPTTDRKEARGEVPTDWELDLSDLARSVKRGRIPHLTWTRALLGGAGAMLSLFLLAVVVVFGPGEATPEAADDGSGEAPPGLAVLPFRVAGDGLEAWQEGLVVRLSRNLDAVAGIRAIDSRTVMARWTETVAENEAPDLATTLQVADRAGARWALSGSAVEVGENVRVSVSVHEVDGGARIGNAVVEGSPDSLGTLVDGLSAEVARALLEREGSAVTDSIFSGLRPESFTTSSPQALLECPGGEADFRRSRFGEVESRCRLPALRAAWDPGHPLIAEARGVLPAG